VNFPPSTIRLTLERLRAKLLRDPEDSLDGALFNECRQIETTRTAASELYSEISKLLRHRDNLARIDRALAGDA
jgi:hypothetical protein